MQVVLDNIWQETRKLSKAEKMELVEKLIHQLRVEERPMAGQTNWEQMYGVGKGIWDMDAQAYVDKIREDRY